jgi:LacI family transcriptional regulator
VANIQDVAAKANVSIATVSRVLNQSNHKVRPATRERVLAVIRELDYRPNALARGLLTKRTMTIGLIIPDISNPYYADIVRGIQDVADENGYNVLLQNTDRKPDRIIKSIYLLREKIVDGVIFSGGIINGYETLSALKELRDRVVVIGRHEVNFPAAMVDNIGAAAEAVQHLIDLGHKRIAYIGGSEDSMTMIDRFKGYESVLAQNGYPLTEDLLMWGDLNPESGLTAAKALLEKADRPTAILAGNDLMAFGVIFATRQMGLIVPDDVAVVGFDNVPLCAYFRPTLTTVDIPRYELGVGAVEMLINLISQNDFSRMRWYNTRLIVRESTNHSVSEPNIRSAVK